MRLVIVLLVLVGYCVSNSVGGNQENLIEENPAITDAREFFGRFVHAARAYDREALLLLMVDTKFSDRYVENALANMRKIKRINVLDASILPSNCGHSKLRVFCRFFRIHWNVTDEQIFLHMSITGWRIKYSSIFDDNYENWEHDETTTERPDAEIRALAGSHFLG